MSNVVIRKQNEFNEWSEWSGIFDTDTKSKFSTPLAKATSHYKKHFRSHYPNTTFGFFEASTPNPRILFAIKTPNGSKPELDITDLSARKLAAETIELALKDLGNKDNEIIRDQANNWFNNKSQKPFSYRWCVETCCVNKNLISEFIEEIKAGKSWATIKRQSNNTEEVL